MNQTVTVIGLVVFGIALIGHYLSQKMLLAKGWLASDASPQIRRLSVNGGILFVLALVALTTATFPYGLAGILLLIEAAVCMAFAKKLRNKQQ